MKIRIRYFLEKYLFWITVTAISCILTILKLNHIINWLWIVVFLPIIIPIILIGCIITAIRILLKIWSR